MGHISKKDLLFENNFEDSTGTSEKLYLKSKTRKIDENGLHVLLNEPYSNLQKGQRLRAELMVFGKSIVWDRYTMSNLHIELISKGIVVSDQHIRIHDVARGPYWIPIQVDIKVRDENIDHIQISIWSNQRKNYLFIDKLKISLIE